MNDNKKKVLTDEELKEVSGGFDYNEFMKKNAANIGRTADLCISRKTKEDCEKNPKCKWSEHIAFCEEKLD